jgi:oligogalacturonide lyase
MKSTLYTLCFTLGALPAIAAEHPAAWVDADTGHRIRRLSDIPGTASLYFHQNAFLKDGHRMIVQTTAGVASLDVETRELKILIPANYYKSTGSSGLEVGRTTGRLYFEHDHALYAVDPEGGTPREVCKLPADGHMSAISSDESLVVGSTTAPGYPPVNTSPGKDVVMRGDDGHVLSYAEMREARINERLEQRVPMTMFTVDIRTGESRTLLRTTDWLGHIQFSPTDPSLILFCHEGNWHRVDRLWTIRSDGSGLTKIHTRHMVMEIWGHEFFGPDGRTVWYDLQTPRGQDFWLAGVELATNRRTWYHLERNQWSVHYNISPDGKRFAGDGGDSEMVAHAPDGKWLYLFTPERISDTKPSDLSGADEWIQAGVLHAERLINMKGHDYRLEPNVRFSPDGQWIVFRSNMEGAVYTYAVEAAKAQP